MEYRTVTRSIEEVRAKLALALDVDDLVVATRLARMLSPYFSTVKVGLELFSATGPESVGALANLGYDVFLDLKLHDIPTTVRKASKVLGGVGATYLTLHAFGGVEMLRAGVEGLAEGAAEAGATAPTALAVTILTSDGGAPSHILPARLAVALDADCGGYVCAAADLPIAREVAPKLFSVVAGIRPAGSDRHDQTRASTPEEALGNGADLLVIGRAVTQADDPVAAAEGIFGSLASLTA
jgi:orotidine-5'-phosphate decarboxylase